jgi:phosphomethylpyrimidine synthase
MCGPKFCSMKITQDLRAEVLAMEEAGEVVGASPAMSKAEAEAGMRAKSEEFLAEGGKLYVDAAE